MRKFASYLKAINVIEAREMMNSMEVAMYPQYSEKHRNVVYERVFSAANPGHKKKLASPNEIKSFLGGKRG